VQRLGGTLLFLLALAFAQFANPPAPGAPAPPLPAPAMPPSGPGGGLLPLPTPAKRYPLPDWIRPGVAFLYQDMSGRITQAYLVTDLAPDGAYGLVLTLVQSPGSPPMYQLEALPLVQNGAGFFYLHPEAVADAVREAQANPTPGLKVVGGSGWFAVESQGPAGTTQYAFRYDPETGLVQEAAVSERYPKGTQAVSYRYLGYQTFDWQSPAEFPPAAHEPHAYELATAVAGFGNPLGLLEIQPLQLTRPLALFQLTANLGGYPQSDRAGGLTALGPHYLHPELIRRGTVFALPKLGVGYTVQGDTATLTWGSELLAVVRLQPESGLVLERRETLPLGQMILRLVR